MLFIWNFVSKAWLIDSIQKQIDEVVASGAKSQKQKIATID